MTHVRLTNNKGGYGLYLGIACLCLFLILCLWLFMLFVFVDAYCLWFIVWCYMSIAYSCFLVFFFWVLSWSLVLNVQLFPRTDRPSSWGPQHDRRNVLPGYSQRLQRSHSAALASTELQFRLVVICLSPASPCKPPFWEPKDC